MSTAEDELPIWVRPEPGTRRPRFTRDQLAAAALRIADTEGFDAVSMRRVAAELGAGTMTLYHYVRTKEDLVTLMDDAVMGQLLLPPEELRGGWRAALTAVSRRTREVLSGHPWSLTETHGARFGPNAMRHFEQSLAALDGLALPAVAKFELLTVVDGYVHGHALQAAEVKTRTTTAHDPQLVAAVQEFGQRQLATGAFPLTEALMAELAAGGEGIGERLGGDEPFERGLAALLDGLARRLDLP
jgi:AcrR family transcriptional regulator